ncbi:MAG TPA: GGDEF domain-containing protein, partial [Rhodospirillales bacterium]|nr:GGDEF domain-containing protein [Rhodospirillales bacterium]
MNNSEQPDPTLLDGYPGAAMLVHHDCAIVAANEKGANLEALLKHGAAPEIPSMVAHAAQEGQIVAGAISLQGAKGPITLEITVVPQTDGLTFVVLAKDTTMERNLRSTLVESRQRFKDLVEISSDFSWEVGPEGDFIFVTTRGALGHKAEDMVGLRPEEFVLNPQEFSPMPFMSNRAVEDVEMWMRKADGSTA